jgi:hypothetical protein
VKGSSHTSTRVPWVAQKCTRPEKPPSPGRSASVTKYLPRPPIGGASQGASTRARVGARGSTRGFYIGMRLFIGVLEPYRMAHTRKHGKNHVFEVPSRRSRAGRVCDAAE